MDLGNFGNSGNQASTSFDLKKTNSNLEKTNSNFEKTNSNLEKTNSNLNLNESNAEIPAEFFDAITNEIMSLPILLPSGKSVDRSTLEKFCAFESENFRSPNDPFTFLPFTEFRKPLPHSSLKLRIDEFFIKHQNLAKKFNVGKTMCGKNYSIHFSENSSKF